VRRCGGKRATVNRDGVRRGEPDPQGPQQAKPKWRNSTRGGKKEGLDATSSNVASFLGERGNEIFVDQRRERKGRLIVRLTLNLEKTSMTKRGNTRRGINTLETTKDRRVATNRLKAIQKQGFMSQGKGRVRRVEKQLPELGLNTRKNSDRGKRTRPESVCPRKSRPSKRNAKAD